MRSGAAPHLKKTKANSTRNNQRTNKRHEERGRPRTTRKTNKHEERGRTHTHAPPGVHHQVRVLVALAKEEGVERELEVGVGDVPDAQVLRGVVVILRGVGVGVGVCGR